MKLFLSGFLLVLQVSSRILCDGVEEARKTEHKSSMSLEVKIDILERYFSLGETVFNGSDIALVNQYEDEVIKKMQMALDDNLDRLDVHMLNMEINTLIYQIEVGKTPDAEQCKPFKPEHEAVLRALDLIVPNTEQDHEIALAKIDLRRFYLTHTELAGELLDRLIKQLKSTELHLCEATKLLKNYYLHWIPLGRLMTMLF